MTKEEVMSILLDTVDTLTLFTGIFQGMSASTNNERKKRFFSDKAEYADLRGQDLANILNEIRDGKIFIFVDHEASEE